MANTAVKRSTPVRSRSGCVACRKLKIKCDESKPVCANCTKSRKDCDYTLKLVWGGRPYKKPKVEKLNKFSNINAISPQQQIYMVEPPKIIEFDNVSSPQIDTIDPLKNLNKLIKMSKDSENLADTKTKPQKVEFFNPIQHSKETVSNINNMIDTLSSFYDNKASQTLPWPILEEIEYPISEITPISIDQLPEHLSIVSPDTPPFEFEFPEITTPTSTALMSIPMINEQRHFTESSSTASLIEPIPRGLLPLPDILLNSPHFYESFQHYVHSTTEVLTPADNTVYKNNPFKYVLPKIAMTNDGLMSLLVAFGLAHRSVLSKVDSTKLIDSLLSRALSDLLTLLNNKETSTSDLTLTIVMLFSSFLAFNYRSDKWKVHMQGAKQILLMRGYNKPFGKLSIESGSNNNGTSINGEIKRTKLVYFLIRWFAYIDIFSKLSSPLVPDNEDIVRYLNDENNDLLISGDGSVNSDDSNNVQIPTSQMDYEITESNEALINDESFNGIDYMIGFDLKLLPIFSRLCDIIKHVNILRKMQHDSKINLSPQLIESAINIQNKFESLKSTAYTTDSNSLNTVIATNACFTYMGLIQLYTRVLLMKPESKLIQSLCMKTLDTFDKYIDTKSPNSVTLVLPLFIAGCEIDADAEVDIKQKFVDKLHDLKQNGSISAEAATEVMITCWNSGRRWYDVMSEENRLDVIM